MNFTTIENKIMFINATLEDNGRPHKTRTHQNVAAIIATFAVKAHNLLTHPQTRDG